MYGAPTDPMPYFVLAFGLGSAILFGYGIWSIWDWRRLKQLEEALTHDHQPVAKSKEAVISHNHRRGEQANG